MCSAGGPYTGFVNEPVDFTGSASGGTPPYSWEWIFGDGATADVQNPTHLYTEAGVYTVTLTVTDDEGVIGIASTTATITSHAPDAPVISGPTNGTTDTVYSFSFCSTDPEEDDVYYFIDWGDGSYTEWNGPHPSGQIININHSWTKIGKSNIIAKAKDSNNQESNWSLPHTMVISPSFASVYVIGVFLEYFEDPESDLAAVYPFFGCYITMNPFQIEIFSPDAPMVYMIFNKTTQKGIMLPGVIPSPYGNLGVIIGKFDAFFDPL